MSQKEDLPQVLLIGDSISIGYMPFVAALLEGVAEVTRPWAPEENVINCGPTTVGLTDLYAWLGSKKWDVIHFNFGLHDIAYRHPDSAEFGNRDKVRGVISVTPEAYEKNLRQIVQLLKDAGATLIWASTTLVPAGEVGRFEGDEIKYNAIAKKIMDENGILINDLHALTAQFPAEYFAGPGDVHYAPQGNEHLAAQVVKFISKVL